MAGPEATSFRVAASGFAAQSQLRQFAETSEVIEGGGFNIAVDEINDAQDRATLILPPVLLQDSPTARKNTASRSNNKRGEKAFYSRYTEHGYDEAQDWINGIEKLSAMIEEHSKDGNGEAIDLDNVIDQTHDNVWQNVYSYAAIAIVLSAFVFFVAQRTFFQTLVAFDVFFFLVSHLNGRIQLLNSRYQKQLARPDKAGRAPTPPSRPLMQTGSLVLGIISQLLIFAFVTVLMSKVTPIVRESALAPSTLARMAILPGLWIGTRKFYLRVRGEKKAHSPSSAPRRDKVPRALRARPQSVKQDHACTRRTARARSTPSTSWCRTHRGCITKASSSAGSTIASIATSPTSACCQQRNGNRWYRHNRQDLSSGLSPSHGAHYCGTRGCNACHCIACRYW